MFSRRLSWLLSSLFCVLFASPVLSGHSSPTTPHDPFHAIAALAPKQAEEPVCCLKPVTSLEPVDDDLFLSFEDWKAKQSKKSNASASTRIPVENPVDDAIAAAAAHPSSSSSIVDAVAHAVDATDAAPAAQSAAGTAPTLMSTPPPPPPASPHFRVPLTDRFNYASMDCSARVHTAHGAAKSAGNILSSKRDRYMLTPCAAAPQFVVVELCEDVRIDTVQLANFEFFSGVFKEFTVSVAKTYAAADAEGWTVVGTYVGKNVRGVQSFHPPKSIRDFYRYIRVDFHSHYSNEYYCPISLLRVYGLTHLEQWKWDTWEEESRLRQDQNAHATVVHADTALLEPGQPAEVPRLAQDDPTTSQESPPLVPPSGDTTPDIQDHSSQPLGSVENGYFRHSTDIARLEPSASPPVQSTSPDSAITATPSSVSSSPPNFVHPIDDSTQQPYMFISNDSNMANSTASSSVFISSRTANVSQSTVTTVSSPSALHASPSFHPPVNPPLPPSSANVHAGESIYRTIMNRLSALEANTTLYARYVEEQTSTMREMLRRLSEDVGRLEGIGRAQAQGYARSVSDFERHRREMEIEQRTLISQVNYLAEEIVLEKRLGVAQLCLLLAVLVFLSITRGSPGEFHMPRAISGADSKHGWSRRSLRLSSDWIPSRLRGVSSGPPSASQSSPTPTPTMPIAHAPRPAPLTAPAAFLRPPPTTPGPGHLTSKAMTATTTTPTYRQKRPPLYLLTPIQNQHQHQNQHSHHRHRGRSRGDATNASPTPISKPTIPMRRSNSHGASASLIGPVPRSARRWARSAHVHEVRRARHQHHHQHQHSTNANVVRVGEYEEKDVFGGRSQSQGRGRRALRSAPAAGSWSSPFVGRGAGADTWVDTETETDDDDSGGDVGLWEIDASAD